MPKSLRGLIIIYLMRLSMEPDSLMLLIRRAVSVGFMEENKIIPQSKKIQTNKNCSIRGTGICRVSTSRVTGTLKSLQLLQVIFTTRNLSNKI
jgi:hypothetical protein